MCEIFTKMIKQEVSFSGNLGKVQEHIGKEQLQRKFAIRSLGRYLLNSGKYSDNLLQKENANLKGGTF